METILYRQMHPGEERAVCDLATRVFNEYVASDYARAGREEFFRFASPGAMKQRMQSGGFVLVALQAEKLVGMLEFFPPDCIAMLFVSLRRQGIAKALLTLAVSKVRAADPQLAKLIVHSSAYAVPVYQKMGFRKTGDATTENGITYFPMEWVFENETTEQQP